MNSRIFLFGQPGKSGSSSAMDCPLCKFEMWEFKKPHWYTCNFCHVAFFPNVNIDQEKSSGSYIYHGQLLQKEIFERKANMKAFW